MAFNAKVGSFLANSTPNKSVAGVGFQPKVVIFFCNEPSSDTDDGNSAGPPCVLGFGVSSSSRVAFYSDDDFSGGDPRTPDATACVRRDVFGGGPSTVLDLDIVTLDSDGFTVAVNISSPNTQIINYLALGGSDLTNVFIKSFTAPTTTGNQSYTGVGFKPDAILMLGGNTNGNFGTGGVGFMSGTSNRGTFSACFDGSNNQRYLRTNKAFAKAHGDAAAHQADLVSFDSDGFTLNWDAVSSFNVPECYALCLKGGRYFVGSFTQKTSTGTQGYTGTGFTPKAILFGSVLKTSSTTVATDVVSWMIGATSGVSERAVMQSAGLAVHPVRALNRTKVYRSLADDGVPTIEATADLSSFDSDGFTLNYTTADATAREVIYMAFGDAAAALQRLPSAGWIST